MNSQRLSLVQGKALEKLTFESDQQLKFALSNTYPCP